MIVVFQDVFEYVGGFIAGVVAQIPLPDGAAPFFQNQGLFVQTFLFQLFPKGFDGVGEDVFIPADREGEAFVAANQTCLAVLLLSRGGKGAEGQNVWHTVLFPTEGQEPIPAVGGAAGADDHGPGKCFPDGMIGSGVHFGVFVPGAYSHIREIRLEPGAEEPFFHGISAVPAFQVLHQGMNQFFPLGNVPGSGDGPAPHGG